MMTEEVDGAKVRTIEGEAEGPLIGGGLTKVEMDERNSLDTTGLRLPIW